MDKKWVEKKKKENKENFEKEKQRIKDTIWGSCMFKPEAEKEFLAAIDALDYEKLISSYPYPEDLSTLNVKLEFGYLNSKTNLHGKSEDDHEYYQNWLDKKINMGKLAMYLMNNFEMYEDSEPIEFDGDIIITDPCYIMRAEHHGTKPLTDNDWDSCDYGYNMEVIGIHNYMTRDTIYGDWQCTTFNTDTGEVIGHFCADAGLVSVIDLSEVLSYNPDFDYHVNREWATTLIKDFKGTVQFVVKGIRNVYEYDSAWCKKGEKYEDYEVEVVGHGVNKVTGEPINFVGKQTGL